MYAKLALQNVRKSIKDYLIYMITLTACTSMFYAFLSISSKYYKPEIGAEFDIGILGNGMKPVILGITTLLVFLVRYVNQFMLRKRQKEFAIQSMIGMETTVVAWLFFAETLAMALLALFAGIVLGVLFSQMITAMLLQMYCKPFQFSFMLFPDTVLLTVIFFLICFGAAGLFQVRAIRKIKIIDMLNAGRQNEGADAAYAWIRNVIFVNLSVQGFMGIYGIRTLSYYFTAQFLPIVKVWSSACMVIPFLMAIGNVLLMQKSRRAKPAKLLAASALIGVIELITVGLLPVLKTCYALPMDKGAFNLYMLFLIWCLAFNVSVFFILFNNGLAALRSNSVKVRYQGENLFFLGQLLSKLNTNNLSMTLICLTLTLSVSLFLLMPILVGWAQGFLGKRVVYDIQMSSDYTGAETPYELPRTDYAFLSDFLQEKRIGIREECLFYTYFLQKSDLTGQIGGKDRSDYPVTAICLSDYNHLMKMLGYEQISIGENEYATQWLSVTPENAIQSYLHQHARLHTDGGTLYLAADLPRTQELGEDLYNFQSVICVVPDLVAESLTRANSYRYMITDKPVPYETAKQMESVFNGHWPKEEQENYSITTRTVEVNDVSAAIFVMQTGFTYSAVILFVICFTILSLQQLSDLDQYKYRFQVLRNIGVEEKKIQKLVIKQLGIWFGVPVGLALILSAVFLFFVFLNFSVQIHVYIGISKLMRQIFLVLTILGALLGCYFAGTWVLFGKAASK